MRFLLSLFLMATMGHLNLMAETDAKEYKTYVKNNYKVFYCTHEGVSVVVDPTEDGLFEPHISIINNSGHEIMFEPKDIRAYAYAIPGNTAKSTRYRVGTFLDRGGDASRLETDSLKIYTPKQYRKKQSRTNWWAMVLTEVVVGSVEQLGPQDDVTRMENALYRRDRNNEFVKMQQEDKRRVDEGYWKANTIFDGSEHQGFIAVKPVKTEYLILDIPVDGEIFHFVVDSKKYDE